MLVRFLGPILQFVAHVSPRLSPRPAQRAAAHGSLTQSASLPVPGLSTHSTVLDLSMNRQHSAGGLIQGNVHVPSPLSGMQGLQGLHSGQGLQGVQGLHGFDVELATDFEPHEMEELLDLLRS